MKKNKYMKFLLYIFTILFIGSSLSAANNFQPPAYEMNASIKVNNNVLAKVADKTITSYDVMKKLEIGFNRAYPDLINSNSARYQFYITGWPHALDELINNQLILIDASKKELKVTDAELREEIESRFGPNVLTNLQKINLTHEEALKITKEEMIIQRMMYFFIKSKADQSITPSAIRNAYRLYCNENPPKETWEYNIVSIKSNDEKTSSDASLKVFELLKEKNSDPIEFESSLKDIEKNFLNCKISISPLYTVTNKEISSSNQKILSSLQKNSYSQIINQSNKTSKDNSYRIFYLKNYEKKLTESFDEMSKNLKDQLLQKALYEESERYFTKLKKLYHVEKSQIITKDFVPFTLE
ncbi:MAG: SurA N-terminal domain-containing protein [Parachlamydiales bacterium]